MRDLLQRLTAPPAQHLRVLQPTCATVSYTVSTRTLPKTLPARLAHYIGIILRTVTGLSAAILLLLKWRLDESEKVPSVLMRLLGPIKDMQLLHVVETWQWTYLVSSALVVMFLALRRGYTEESLTVLRGLGIQTSTTSSTYLQTPTTRFIPTTSIQDILIHEAFKGFEVRFYLAIVVDGEDDVVVVYPRLLPKRAILEEVWRGARKCLWEGNAVDSEPKRVGTEGS